MDNRTMMVMTLVTLIICAPFMIISSHSHKPGSGGRFLSVWLALQFAGMILITSQGYTPVFPGVFASNILIAASVIFLAWGLFQSMQIHINRYLLVFFVLYTLGHFIYSLIVPLTFIRIAVFSLFMSFIYLYAGLKCIKNIKKSNPFAYAIIVILLVNSLFYFIQAIYAMIHPMNSIFNHDIISSIAILLFNFTIIGITLGSILLQNQNLIHLENEMEDEIQKKEGRYQDILDNMIEGCQIIGYDYRYIYVNKSSAKHLLFSQEEMIGHTMMEKFSGIENTDMFKTLKYCMENREEKQIENEFNYPDGSKRYFNLSFQTVTEGIFILSEDITEHKMAQEALRKSEQRLKFHFENSPLAVVERDADLVITQWSNEAERIFGWKKEEVLGKRIDSLNIIYPEDASIVNRIVERLKSGKETLVVSSNRNNTKSGTVISCIWHNSVLLDQNNNITSILSLVQDVTESKRAEEALMESNARANAILNATTESLWFMDLEGNIFGANETAARRLGKTVDEVTGKNGFAITPPGVWEKRKAKIREMVDTEQSVQFEDERNGIEFHHTFYPVRDVSGNITRFVIFSRDITGRKKAEKERECMLAELNQRAAELDAVFEALPFLVSVHGPDGKYLKVNPAIVKLFGFDPTMKTREEIALRLNAEFPGGVPLNPSDLPSEKALKGETVSNVEYIVSDINGQRHTLLFNAVPLISGNHVYGAVFAQADVTDLKNAEMELLQAKEAAEKAYLAKSLFTASISHELRTPLNAILGYAQLLKKSGLSEKQLESIEVIYKSGNHLLNMINDLLDMSAIEAGKIKIEKKVFSLPDLLKKVAEMIRVQAEEKNLEFIFKILSEIPSEVIGDEKKLQQILLNLLSNAVKFTDNGSVFLRVGRNEDNIIHFEVEDTGIGIPQDQTGVIFDSFNQLEGGLSKTKGTGLGLTISRNLVRLMGSDLFVKSETGKGSTFWFDMDFNLLKENWITVKPMTAEKKNEMDSENKDMPLPPEEDLKLLYNMAKNGDIIHIRRYVEAAGKKYSRFISVLKVYSKNIDLKGMTEFLLKFLKENKN